MPGGMQGTAVCVATDAQLSLTACPCPWVFLLVRVCLQVMVLIFLWPICNGLLEACERVEASAQQVLRPAAAQHGTSTVSKPAPRASAAVSWPSVLPAWQRLLASYTATKQGACNRGPGLVGGMREPGQGQGPGSGLGCMARLRSSVAAGWGWVGRLGQWANPLLQLVLVKPVFQAVHQALTQDVPKALSSKQGELLLLVRCAFVQISVQLSRADCQPSSCHGAGKSCWMHTCSDSCG